MMGGMTITEFLLARIEEDEERAKLAAFGWGGEWQAVADHEEEWYTIRAEGKREVLGSEDSDVTCHIARHDPTRVLAECAAKRAIINEHEMDLGMAEPYCDTCAEWWKCELGEGPPPVAYPCPTLRAVAAIYKDHSEYRGEWAL